MCNVTFDIIDSLTVPVTEFLRSAAPSVFYLKAAIVHFNSIFLFETYIIFDTQRVFKSC